MDRNKTWKRRWSHLIRKVDRVHSTEGRHELIQKLSHPNNPMLLAFVNAHAMNLLTKSESFFLSLCAADTVLRDGSGMETLFNQLNIPPGLNLNGTDLIPDIVGQFNGRCIALLGTQEPYLKSGVEYIETSLAPKSSCFCADGFLDVHEYISLVTKHQPSLIVLGMGMPRQEEVAIALRSTLTYPCLIICGGAIIDFWGGRTSRAPLWMREKGLEWLFRLQMEPRRLFRRYVIGNLVFLVRAFIFSAFNRRLSRQVLKSQT